MTLNFDRILTRIAVRGPVNQQNHFVCQPVIQGHVAVDERISSALRWKRGRADENTISKGQTLRTGHPDDGDRTFSGRRGQGRNRIGVQIHDRTRIIPHFRRKSTV